MKISVFVLALSMLGCDLRFLIENVPRIKQPGIMTPRFKTPGRKHSLTTLLIGASCLVGCLGRVSGDDASCGGTLDLGQEEASTEFDLCVTYCTLNRAGSETTECYQPVEECPDVCQGVTGFCSSELNHLVECQLNAGASLVCLELNGELNPWVEFIDGVCEEESARVDNCYCHALDITCPE